MLMTERQRVVPMTQMSWLPQRANVSIKLESILALCEGEIVKDPKWEIYVIAL